MRYVVLWQFTLLLSSIATATRQTGRKASQTTNTPPPEDDHPPKRCIANWFRVTDEFLYGPPRWVHWPQFLQEYVLSQTQKGQPEGLVSGGHQLKLGLPVALQVSSVPCLRDRCCPLHTALRAGYDDYRAFEQVFVAQQLEPLYKQLETAPEVILDVGAFAGYNSLWLHMRFPDALIIAVEPDLDSFMLAKANTMRVPRLQVVHGAVWPKKTNLVPEGKTEGLQPRELPSFERKVIAEGFSNHTYREVEQAEHGAVRALPVPALLAAFKLQKVDLVLLDVNGAHDILFYNDAPTQWLQHCTAVALVMPEEQRLAQEEAATGKKHESAAGDNSPTHSALLAAHFKRVERQGTLEVWMNRR